MISQKSLQQMNWLYRDIQIQYLYPHKEKSRKLLIGIIGNALLSKYLTMYHSLTLLLIVCGSVNIWKRASGQWFKSSLISPLPCFCFRARKWHIHQTITSITCFSISLIPLKFFRLKNGCGSSSIDERFEMCACKQGSFKTQNYHKCEFSIN